MIHYSIIPLETIYDGIEQYSPVYTQLTIQGVRMDVEPINMHQGRIVRLYSPIAQDYMNPKYAPGQIVNLMGMNVSLS